MCIACATQQPLGGDFDSCEADLGRPVSIDIGIAVPVNARTVGRDKQDRDTTSVTIGTCSAHGDQQLIGIGAIEHENFTAVDDKTVALTHGSRGDAGQVVTAVRLGQRAGQLQPAPHDLRQPLGPLLRTAQLADQAATQHRCSDKRLDHHGLAKFF